MSEEKEDRNKQIVLDKNKGMSWTEMVLKYKLSATRLQYIYRRENKLLQQ